MRGHRPAPADGRRAGPAQPGRPDRALDDAPGAGGARLLVRVRVDAVRPGALPVRERGLVRAPLPGRLHRRVHRADARLVLHHARAGHGAVRPAGVPHLRRATASCRARTAARCPRACATTRTSTRCSTCTASDAMRWMLMSSPVLRGGDMPVTETGIRDAVRHVLLPLWNVWYFFSLYANAESYAGRGRAPTARTCSTGTCWPRPASWSPRSPSRWTPTTSAGPAPSVRSYLDALTNWYVRRSRDRFWAGDRDAFDTLYTVLETLCRVVAPLAPLTAEEIWRGLTGERSVHLTDWPSADDVPGRRRRWCPRWTRSARSARPRCRCARPQGLRVRLPLRTLTVATPRRAAAGAVRRPRRRRGQREGGRLHRRRRRALRAGAHRGAAGARPARRRAGAAGHQGGQGGRLDACRRPAGRRGRHARGRRVRAALVAADARAAPRRCPAARAWSCSTPR